MKTDLLIGIMSIVLYILLGLAFFLCMSINNVFLRNINRTLATTLLTFTAMTVAMHAVYGGFQVGRKKNKPVISAMISGVAITDLVTYLQLQIMNVNDNYNEHLVIFGPDLLCLLLCLLIQILVIIIFVRFGNQLYFRFTPPRSCLLVLGSPVQEYALADLGVEAVAPGAVSQQGFAAQRKGVRVEGEAAEMAAALKEALVKDGVI